MAAPERVNTSRDLAALAGVSHMTVSRAFRGDVRVRPETRDRILALAEKHGYRPNPVVALAMQAKRKVGKGEITGTLAFVHSNLHEDSWRTLPHLQPYLEGMRRHSLTMGFALDEFWIGPKGLPAARLNQILHARGIRGVVVAPPPGFVGRVNLDWEKFACVTFNHDSWRPLLHRVAVDDLHKISVVLREVARLGYKRPGLAVPYNLDAKASFALSGRLLVAQQAAPASQRVRPFIFKPPEIGDVARDFQKWLGKSRPDCIICSHVDAVRLVENAGLRVPGDTGVVHLEIGPDVAEWSGYLIDRAAIGATAVDMLINRMLRNETGIPKDPREVLLRGKWQAGKTTRRMP